MKMKNKNEMENLELQIMENKAMFRLDRIFKIIVKKKKRNKSFIWLPEKKTVNYSFFGLFKTTEYFEPGLYYKGDYHRGILDYEKLDEEYYVSQETVTTSEKTTMQGEVLYRKSLVEIHLEDDVITEYFDKDEQAFDFADSLVKKTRSNFETLFL